MSHLWSLNFPALFCIVLFNSWLLPKLAPFCKQTNQFLRVWTLTIFSHYFDDMLRQFLKKRTLVTSVDVVVSCVFSGDFFAFFFKSWLSNCNIGGIFIFGGIFLLKLAQGVVMCVLGGLKSEITSWWYAWIWCGYFDQLASWLFMLFGNYKSHWRFFVLFLLLCFFTFLHFFLVHKGNEILQLFAKIT